MRRLPVLCALALALSACGGTSEPGAAADEPLACPVTLPGEGFVAPGAHPEPSLPGHVWYGTPELYLPLPVDGDYGVRKGVWWSVDFPGGGVEPQPELTVTYVRLDVEQPPITHGDPGTNANTAEDGWFMMAGIDPVGGCYEVTATYKGTSLTYVYDS